MFRFRAIKYVPLSRIICKFNTHEACVNLVKTHDYENYFTGLLFPRMHRQNFYAIHGFNTEMALIKYSVRGNATAGRVRYKWWNDYISQLYTNHPSASMSDQHPVADSLRRLIQQNRVSRRWFESVIEARTRDLLPPQIHTLSDMEDTVEKTHSSILYLTLEAMDIVDGLNGDGATASPLMHMASHIGVAFGLVSMLRGVAHDLSKSEVRLPTEALLNHGLPPTDLVQIFLAGQPLSPTHDAALREVVFDVASQAHAHLEKAREIQLNEIAPDVKSKSMVVMLPAVLASDFLDKLRVEADFHPLHPSILQYYSQKQSPFMMQMKLLRALWMEKIH